MAAGKVQGGKVDANSTVTSTSLPSHCSLIKYENGTTIAYFNEGVSKAACGGGEMFLGSFAGAPANTSASLHLDATVSEGEATITLTGPAGSWFAASFGSPNYAMADKPWTVVVDGK